MKLSILIVNWNSKDLLRECLSSIRRTCDGLSPQVIVVDGGSFDGCDEMLAKEFPEVEFVQSRDNLGFGRSNNLGFSRVKGELVLLLNPDTELREGAVGNLLDAISSHPDAGVVGAHLLNTDGSLQMFGIHPLPTPWSCMVDSDWVRNRWWAKHGPPEEGNPLEVEAVSGACMLMKSEVFRAVGGFSRQYFMYAEDMDFCLKVLRTGLKVYYAPDAKVVHHGGGSSGSEFSKFSTIMIREAWWIYMRLNHGVSTAVFYRFLMGLSAFLRLVPLTAVWSVSRGASRRGRMMTMKKWTSVMSWSVGMETWARDKFKECEKLGDPVTTSCNLLDRFSKPC